LYYIYIYSTRKLRISKGALIFNSINLLTYQCWLYSRLVRLVSFVMVERRADYGLHLQCSAMVVTLIAKIIQNRHSCRAAASTVTSK
jgi:hypothetical protein